MNTVIIILPLFLLLFFFQINETAFLSSYKYREQKEKTYIGSIILNLYKNAGIYLFSLRFTSIAILATSSYQIYHILDTLQIPANFFVKLAVYFILSFFILIIGAIIIPRSIGAKYPDKVLYHSAFYINIINSVTLPLTRILLAIPKQILRIFHIPLSDDKLLALTGTRGITLEHSRHPQTEHVNLHGNNLKIYRKALEFSNVRVKDCMVPRTEIIGIEQGDSQEELLECFVKSGKTRIIVYNDDIDHIIGYFHSSDMFNKPSDKPWTELISEIPIVPEAMGAQKMMQIFLKEKKSLAVVVDEYGGTSGIISLEDLVEEIFGEIEDEHDTIKYTARKLNDNEYLLSARLEIEKVNELFDLNLPCSEEYATIGGLILFHYENFPKENQTIDIDKYRFHIQKVSKTKINLVKLTQLQDKPEATN